MEVPEVSAGDSHADLVSGAEECRVADELKVSVTVLVPVSSELRIP